MLEYKHIHSCAQCCGYVLHNSEWFYPQHCGQRVQFESLHIVYFFLYFGDYFYALLFSEVKQRLYIAVEFVLLPGK